MHKKAALTHFFYMTENSEVWRTQAELIRNNFEWKSLEKRMIN